MDRILAFASFLFAVSAAAPAQQHDLSPGDKLHDVACLAGDWSGKQNFNTNGGPAMVGDAVDHIQMVVGGRFIEETLSTTLPGRKPTDTRHILTFDPKTGHYRAWWFNDTSVDPTVFEGSLTGNKLVLETAPAGPRLLRATYEKQSDSQFTWTLQMKAGDNWQELFHTTYTKS
jgi:hypothetical protein